MVQRLVYVHTGDLNSGQANVVHVARMTDAFSGIVGAVKLVAFAKGGFRKEDFSLRFGLRRSYEFRVVQLGYRFSLNVIRLWWNAFIATRFGTSGLIYTRSPLMAALLSVLPLSIILEIHAPLASQRSRTRRLLHFLLGIRRFLALVVISEKLKSLVEAELRESGITSIPSIVVAHDGANPCKTTYEKEEKKHKLRAGYAGHLYPGRGIDLIVECAKQCVDIDFTIAGGDDASVAEWVSATKDVSNINFLGRIDPVDVERFLVGCDILLAPYAEKVYTQGGAFETAQWMSPLKIFEYMAVGRPIICSDLPVIREILEHKKSAILCKAGDSSDWVRALKLLEKDPLTRQRLAEASRADLNNKYTWDARVELILNQAGVKYTGAKL